MMEETGIQPLSLVKAGQKGIVVALTGGREFQNRLVSMGLNVGCELEVVHSGDGRGGPTLVATGESRIAIGHGMLDRIQIAVDPE
jgi:Fe2+ transport system protein FeoA